MLSIDHGFISSCFSKITVETLKPSLILLYVHILFHYQKAMDVVGFTPDEKRSIYSLLSAVLNLGNVTFEEGEDHGEAHDFVTLSNEECKLCLHGHYLVSTTVSLNV